MALVGLPSLLLAGLAALLWMLYTNADLQANLATSGRLGMAALIKKDTQLDLAALLSVQAYPNSGYFRGSKRAALHLVSQSDPADLSSPPCRSEERGLQPR